MLGLKDRIPALLAALAACIGVGLAGFLSRGDGMPGVPAHGPTVAGLLLCVLSAVNAVGGAGERRGRALLADVALLAALALAAWAHYDAVHLALPPEHIAVHGGAGHVAVRSRLVEVRRSSAGHSNVVLDALELVDPSAPGLPGRPASGLAWARWPDGEATPAKGDVAVLAGEFRCPGRPRNPAAFDFAFYLRNRRIHRTLAGGRLLSRERATGHADVAAWIYRTLPRRVPGVPGEVLRGLLLGTGRELPEELTQAFRRSGTVHVLAVSGLHVGFIVLIVHGVLRSLRVPRRAARLLVLPALVAFVLIVGARPSVVRASAMAAFLMAAPLLERRPNPLNALGAAALALLIVRPGSLFDLGFQLSFSAVGGILLLHRPFEKTLSAAFGARGRWVGRFAAPLALSLSAQVGVAPILIGVFGEVSVVSPIANLAVVPLAGISVASGIALLVFDPLGSWPASAFAACAWCAIRLLVLVTEFLGNFPWATVRVASRFWPAVLCATAGLCLRVRAESVCGRRAGLAVLVGSAALTAALGLAGPGRSFPRVVFFDVGQGDSILFELPRRRYMLVDAGPGPTSADEAEGHRVRDTGRDVVLPHLRHEGVTRLDGLVITHAHADHFGGAASVLSAVTVDTLFLPAGRSADARLVELVRLAESRGTTVREVRSGDTLSIGGFRFSVLWPDAHAAAAWSENEASLVLRGLVSECGVLLTGDIERRAEGRITAAREDISAWILKVPHHGSGTSSTEAFVRRVSPGLAVVQVGERNRHGHPDVETVQRLDAARATVLRTDLDGAVVVTIRGGRPVARGVVSGRKCVLGERQESSNETSEGVTGPTVTNEQFSGSMTRRAASSTPSRVTDWMMDG
ncbi:MAG: DNA internalization-related competence protein ComEC/Rec2 [Candidatus Eisenbacteria bacterium]